jgi:hypothetical protein
MAYRIKNCKICGNEFMPHSRNNTVCNNPECKKMRVSINQKNFEIRKKERLVREKNNSFLNNASLNEKARKAKESGMSYGKYDLMMQQGII